MFRLPPPEQDIRPVPAAGGGGGRVSWVGAGRRTGLGLERGVDLCGILSGTWGSVRHTFRPVVHCIVQ